MVEGPVLVTAATGTQGGAVIDALLNACITPVAYVRDARSAPARALEARGVRLAVGGMDDREALQAAMADVRGVFSVPIVGSDQDPGLEMRIGQAVVEAAIAVAVPMMVHSSVARAGDHERFAGWKEGRWWNRYWEDKAALNRLVREAGLARWCILKPTVLMDNHIPPKAQKMEPLLFQRRIVTAMKPETKVDRIAVSDVAAFALAAFTDPERFAGHEIDLASESLTMAQVAAVYSEVTGYAVTAEHLTERQATEAGLSANLIKAHLWNDVEGYRVDLGGVSKWGVPLTPLRDWAIANRAALTAVIKGS